MQQSRVKERARETEKDRTQRMCLAVIPNITAPKDLPTLTFNDFVNPAAME